MTGASLLVADRASKYSCAAARSLGVGDGAACGSALTDASGTTGAVATAGAATAGRSALAGRAPWTAFAAGADDLRSGTAATFFAGSAFGAGLLIVDGFAARGGAFGLPFATGLRAATFGAAFFGAGFLAAGFEAAFFATGFAAFLAGGFFAAAMSCLPRPTSVGAGLRQRARHASRPLRIASFGKLRPMKTILVEGFSSLPQGRPTSAPMSM
jgi:hypothetical protein